MVLQPPSRQRAHRNLKVVWIRPRTYIEMHSETILGDVKYAKMVER